MVKVDLTKKIVNMSGDIVEHKYYKKNKENKNGVEEIIEDMTVGIAIQNSLLTKVSEDIPQNFMDRKNLIDRIDKVDEIELTEDEVEFINFSIMRKYELYEASQVLELINKK